MQLKERIIFKTSSGLLSPVNAVIFPIKISFNLRQLSSILMCIKKKKKRKTANLQEKPDVRLKSHFEALLSGENISSRPEGQREREKEREREGVGPSARM